MRKVLLTIFLGATLLTVGCSKDDMATAEPQAAVTAKAMEKPAESLVPCIDPERIETKCISAAMRAPLTINWDNSKVNYAFNRVYRSYLQIESNHCQEANLQPVSIPIHFFSDSSYTLPEGRAENCFKYRIVIMGYDKGEQTCETILPWQVFDYSEQEAALKALDTISAPAL